MRTSILNLSIIKTLQRINMKIIGLDIGDVWVGIAISDALGMFARPYKTIRYKELDSGLKELFTQEKIGAIVIGYPKTMRGTISAQTEKIEQDKQRLETAFPEYPWILWDERLSSKRAQTLKQAKTQEQKQQSHAIAAAFILSSYLEFNRPKNLED
jgi:putative Holliday junction resolvase